jgi:hypothetical protein
MDKKRPTLGYLPHAHALGATALGPFSPLIRFAVRGRTRMTEQRPVTRPDRVDIFLCEADGSSKWVAATETLALAREKVVQNPASSDHEFLIVDSNTGETTLIEPTERPPGTQSNALVGIQAGNFVSDEFLCA